MLVGTISSDARSAPDRDGSGGVSAEISQRGNQERRRSPPSSWRMPSITAWREASATLCAGDRREGSFGSPSPGKMTSLTIVFAVGQVPVEKIPNPLIVFMQALAVAGAQTTYDKGGRLLRAVVAKLPRFGDPMAQIADSPRSADPGGQLRHHRRNSWQLPGSANRCVQRRVRRHTPSALPPSRLYGGGKGYLKPTDSDQGVRNILFDGLNETAN